MLVTNISLNLVKVTHAVSVDRNIPYLVMPLACADKVCINLLQFISCDNYCCHLMPNNKGDFRLIGQFFYSVSGLLSDILRGALKRLQTCVQAAIFGFEHKYSDDLPLKGYFLAVPWFYFTYIIDWFDCLGKRVLWK